MFSVVLQSRFAAVMSTQEWMHSVKIGEVPVRDNIYKSNQRARGLLRQRVLNRQAAGEVFILHIDDDQRPLPRKSPFWPSMTSAHSTLRAVPGI